MRDARDPPPTFPPPPVLPYRGDDGNARLPLPPAAGIYRMFGVVALTAAGAAWMLALGGVAGSAATGDRDKLGIGCCLGTLPWVVSTTLAASVVARDHGIGRRLALVAFVLDMLLLATTLGVWKAL